MKNGGLTMRALFAVAGSIVAASVYFSLGVVTKSALGFAPIVFIIASLFFFLAAMSYSEGLTMYREPGGSTVVARYAFNELVSFIAGWAILIDYLILIALCAVTVSNYAGEVWGQLGTGQLGTLLMVSVIVYVTVSNILGIAPRRLPKIVWVNFLDLTMQVAVISLGLLLVFSSTDLVAPIGSGLSPSLSDLLLSITIAAVAFPGLEAATGITGDVHESSDQEEKEKLVKLVLLGSITVVLTYTALGAIAVSALLSPTGEVSDQAIKTPIIEIVSQYDVLWVANTLKTIVPFIAIPTLIAAASSSMLGLSRLSYSLARNRQVPDALAWLHKKHATPYVTITIGGAIAASLAMTRNIEFLLGLYAFGAMLTFTIVHISICVLRFKEPNKTQRFRVPFSIKIGKGSIPVPAVIGALGSFAAWIVIIVIEPNARVVGILWLVFGLVLYITYRVYDEAPVLKRVYVPERALMEDPKESQFGSILVPLTGTPLDDDIVQTAGRLAADSAAEEEGGDVTSTIEVIWVFEIPISLPIDAEMPAEQIQTARKALNRAKAVGEEYSGVEVSTAVIRSRKAGKAIVDQAVRRGVEVIVLAAEPPSRTKGGLLLGSVSAPRDSYIGSGTSYVIENAPCRVVLTAPPAEDVKQDVEADPTEDATQDVS